MRPAVTIAAAPPSWSTVPRPWHEAVAHLAAEGVEVPVGEVADVDGVHVGVDGEGARAAAEAAEHVAEPVGGHLVEPGLAHLARQLDVDLALLPAERLDAHQAAEIGGGVVPVLAGELQDLGGVGHDDLLC